MAKPNLKCPCAATECGTITCHGVDFGWTEGSALRDAVADSKSTCMQQTARLNAILAAHPCPGKCLQGFHLEIKQLKSQDVIKSMTIDYIASSPYTFPTYRATVDIEWAVMVRCDAPPQEPKPKKQAFFDPIET